MKLGDICAAPCFKNASEFVIPHSGCGADDFKFADSDGRQYYSILLANHDRHNLGIRPKLGIMGLSPAATQIDEFVKTYAGSKNYAEAAIKGTFTGLAKDIIRMFKGTGLSAKLGLRFPDPASFANHPQIYASSLVACASLDTMGGSNDFEVSKYEGSLRCATKRFVNETRLPQFTEMGVIVFLGSKAKEAVTTLKTHLGKTILQELEDQGKKVLFFPHPSGQNMEFVNLAVLSLDDVPKEKDYVSQKWDEYRLKPPRRGRGKEPEVKYKAKRGSVWNSVYELRLSIAALQVAK